MNDKIGSMSKGSAWLFALGAGLLSIVVTYIVTKANLPGKVEHGLHFAIFIGAAVATIVFTKAGKGTAIGAGVVGALLCAVGSYFILSMIVSAGLAKGVDTTDAVGNANGHVALSAGASAVGGAIAGAITAVINFVVAFAGSMVGAFGGGAVKEKMAAEVAVTPRVA